MSDAKRQVLQTLLDDVKSGRIPAERLKYLAVADVDGKTVKLSSPDAIAVIEARLAQLEQLH